MAGACERLCSAILIACSAAACTTDPDVVATRAMSAQPTASTDAALISSPPAVERCRPGRYEGITVAKEAADGGSQIPFSGQITFTLVESLSGEFLVLQNNAKLTGMAASGSMFKADIGGGNGCVDGEFGAYLSNGLYELNSSVVLDFEGPIHGTYFGKDLDGFVGDWTTHLSVGGSELLTVTGKWNALWIGSK